MLYYHTNCFLSLKVCIVGCAYRPLQSIVGQRESICRRAFLVSALIFIMSYSPFRVALKHFSSIFLASVANKWHTFYATPTLSCRLGAASKGQNKNKYYFSIRFISFLARRLVLFTHQAHRLNEIIRFVRC